MNYKVTITGIDHYGRGIARIDNIITFIPNALPNEIVEIKIINKKKKFMEGQVLNFIKKNKNRCQFCNINCGSCHLNNINYSEQLTFKEKKVLDIISKFTKGNYLIKNIIKNPNPTNYRNKVRFHVEKSIGYYKNKSHEIVEINNCLIVDQKINNLLSYIKENINLENIYEIIIRASKYTDDTMVVFKINNTIDEKKFINILKNKVSSLIIFDKNYKTIYGNDYIIEKLNELSFVISPDSFFQVNTAGAICLYNKVLEYANLKQNDNVLDLYCGTGSIGIYLSKYCKKVIGIEINKYAILDAEKNKKLNNIDNIDFICGDTSKLVNNLKQNFDVTIVDPPRAGLDQNTINYLNKSNTKKIVYVSCDPVTLARDLNLLKDKYDILEITPVDMFSYTYHVECVSVLRRKGIGK